MSRNKRFNEKRVRVRQNYKPKNRCDKTGKVRYRNEKDATITLKNLQSYNYSGDDSRQEKRVYMCPQCNGWHLTSAQEYISKRMVAALQRFDKP